MSEHIFVRAENGSVIKMDLPLPEAIADRFKKGYLSRVADEDGNPFKGDEHSDPSTPGTPADRPAVNASKAEWVGWAVAESERRGDPITPDQAEAATKQDLIEKFGTAPASDPSTPE